MKKIFLILIISLFSFQVQGQEDNELNEMITSSIDSFITNEKSLVKQGYSLNDTCRYYICMDGLPEGFSYKGIQTITFFSLNSIERLPNYLKHKLKKGMRMLFIGLKISNNQLVISVGGRGVKRLKKGNLSIAISDWCFSTYEYSCERKKWILVKNRYGGI
jgi:hypothetical protein